ncbi:MAG: N-acetylmuramoyl-L-alanine amidase [Coraliomargarita sp.]|nr:N-acetylmuramoyl-L-alanine amidase [Coraliomargarita sp.]
MRGGAGQFWLGLPAISRGLSVFFIFAACVVASGVSVSARQVQIEGRGYRDLASVAANFGMQGYWLKGTNIFRLKSRWTIIDFGTNRKICELNKTPVYLGFPTVKSGERLYVAEADIQHALKPILTPQVFPERPGLKRIVIDPGHGGKDSGARNDQHGHQEKQLTMDVAKRLQTLLEEVGYEVVLTRRDDRYIPLGERPRMANRAKADLFISIHFNAAASSSAAGYETFALTPQYQASSKYSKPSARDRTRYRGNDQDTWNTLSAYHLQRSLVESMGGPDRGLKRARFLVLKDLKCPGALVELGFMSHGPTAQKLRSSVERQRIAQALFKGILAYRNRLQRIR